MLLFKQWCANKKEASYVLLFVKPGNLTVTCFPYDQANAYSSHRGVVFAAGSSFKNRFYYVSIA